MALVDPKQRGVSVQDGRVQGTNTKPANRRAGVIVRVRVARDERVRTAHHPRSRSFSRLLARHVDSPADDVLWRSEEPVGFRSSLIRAFRYIDEHLGEDLTLESMAAEVALSPYYFARLFKQAAGISPHQYVIRRRVERAKQLLESQPWTVAQVAAAVGFCDQSHLARHFRRLLGRAPAELLAERKNLTSLHEHVQAWERPAA